jgi:GTP pyrophosphokinase
LSNEKANIRSLEARTNIGEAGEGADIEMTIDIRDKKQLEKVFGAIRRTSGVRDVKRLFH